MLISVMLGGITKYTENGQPYNEGGTPGYMDTDELKLVETHFENEREIVDATEYWDGDVIRHRSVNLVLKEGINLTGLIGALG